MSPSGEKTISWRERLLVRLRVLEALAVRDMMMRYGRGNLGFLWVLLEPMVLTVGVMSIWSIMKGEREHGLSIIALVLTGYMPLTLWRHVTNCSVLILRRNSSLLYHRHITYIDVLLGRLLLEFVGATAALIVVMSALLALGLVGPPKDFGLLILGWIEMGILASSLGLIMCLLTEYAEVWERFVQPFQYLMLPASGAFFMVEWLPTRGQELVLFNPTVHCFELFRAGYLGPEFPTHYSIWYPLVWSLAMISIGLKLLDSMSEHFRLD